MFMALLLALSFVPGYAPLLVYAGSEETVSDQLPDEAAGGSLDEAAETPEAISDEGAAETLQEPEAEDLFGDAADAGQAEEEQAVLEEDEEAAGGENADEVKAEPESATESEPAGETDPAPELQPAAEPGSNDAAEFGSESGSAPARALKSAPLKSSTPVETITLTLNDDFNVPDVTYTPTETGYYEFALNAAFDADSFENGRCVDLGFSFFEDGGYIGQAWLCQNGDGVPSVTLYMKNGKEYTFEISKYSKADAEGYLSVSKLDETDVEGMFTIKDGALESYTGNMVNVRIPEGVTNVYSSAYASMAENLHWGTISVHYPSTMAEGSITGEGLNNNTYAFWDMNYSLYACRFDVDSDCPSYKSIDGVVYSKDGTKLIAVPKYYYDDELRVAEGTVSIEESAFGWGGGVGTVELPDSLEVIKESAFYHSTGLNNISFGSNLKEIENYAFSNSGVVSLDLPKSLETMGQNAFGSCHDLKSVTFNSKLEVEYWTFVACDNLETININDNIVWRDGAFEKCTSIKEVNVGSKASEWELRDKCLVFKYDETNHPSPYGDYDEETEKWTALVMVLKDYDSDTFVMDDDIERVYQEAFPGIDCIRNFTVGKKCNSINLFMDLEAIAVSSGNTTYSTEKGVLYSNITHDEWGSDVTGQGRSLEKFPMLSDVTEFTLPADVKEIAGKAFATYSGCNRTLKKLIVPVTSKLETIDGGAFSFCSTAWYDDSEYDTLTLAGKDGSPLHNYYGEYKNDEHLAWESLAADNTVKVTFNPNGGTVTKKSVTKTKGSAVGTLPKATRKGYTFTGWYTKKTGGTKITAKTVVKANVTYYAHWSCKVKFNANGGKASATSRTVAEGAAIGTLPTAKRSNYYFLGWYTKKSGGTKITAKTVVKAGTTYYAHWAKAEISNATVTVKDCTWNGKAQKPAVTVKFKGYTLKKGTDYTVSYSNNKEVGKGKVTIKGKGVFAKSKKTKTAIFKINKAAQKITASDVTYSAGTTGYKTIKIGVKEKAEITLTSSDKSRIKICTTAKQKKKGNIKVVAPGEVKITIKTKATKHYKAGEKTITVVVKGDKRPVSISSSWLTYDKSAKVYKMTDNVVNKLISIDRGDNAGYTCTIETSGRENEVWVEKGNLLTAKGKGDFKIKVVVQKSKAFPASTTYFTIRKSGLALTGVQYLYRENADYTVDILKYVGNSSVRSLTVNPTMKIANKYRSITKISDGAFADCQVAKMEFRDPSSGSGITTIGKSAFARNKALSSIILPKGVTSLGDSAFSGCTNLNRIQLPNTIKVIGKSAFSGCGSLEGTLYLPGSLTQIGESAFNGCKNLDGLVVFNYLKTVGANAFKGTTGIKYVYYSASSARWKAIQFASGNDLVKNNSGLLYNVGAPVYAYSTSNISDETLFRDAPEYLMNPGYEFISGEITDATTEILYGMSDFDIGLAALKAQMKTGKVTRSLKSIIDVVWHMQTGSDKTWEEEEINKELALGLLEDVVETEKPAQIGEILTGINEYRDILDSYRSKGEKIFLDEVERDQVAAALDGIILHKSKEDIQNELAEIGKYWKENDEVPDRTWSISGILNEVTGRAADAVDFYMTFVELNEYYRAYIDAIMEVLPEGTGIYEGFDQLKDILDQPYQTYIAQQFREDIVGTMASHIAKYGYGLTGGETVVAGFMYQILGEMIDAPSIDDMNRAWLETANARHLRQVMMDLNTEITQADASARVGLMRNHRLVTKMYFCALKKAGEYTSKSVKNKPAKQEIIDGLLSRFSPGLNYSSYLSSCKENIADHQQYSK